MSKLRSYFEKVGKVIAAYAAMIIVTAVPILFVIALSPIYVEYSSVWTSELNATYTLIYNYRQRYSCCFRLDITKTLTVIAIVIVVVAGAFTVMFIYMHIDIYLNIRKQSKGFQQSIQTVRMQTTLYQAIIAQSVCITFFYVIPVFVSIIALFAELPMVSVIITGTVQTIFAYEFFNLVLTLYFIKPYRAQVVRSIMTFWRCLPSRKQTSAQQRTVHVVPLK
uniref:G_PROTEIN_RECEP_F1_2 domain-containing protein n=1 Tax=Panagrellus redivivus TaxID=6233 RepID=A0A7E4VJ72_PANRE